VEATEDPVLCGPCTLVRWRRVLDTEATHKSVKTLIEKAKAVTADGYHPCHTPKLIDQRTLEAPLLPPINQWGQMPYPLESLSRTPPPASPGRPSPASPTTKPCRSTTSSTCQRRVAGARAALGAGSSAGVGLGRR
jgi:hypothetical protein